MLDAYDIVVIGGGHAGTEAAWAAASVLEHAGGGRVVGVVVPAGAGLVRPDHRAIDENLHHETKARPVYPSASREADVTRVPRTIGARAIVLTTGTFMRALMHTGRQTTEGGRVGEGSARGMSSTLCRLGFELGRLKTGTPPRLARSSIDWAGLDRQVGDRDPRPFSDLSPDVLPVPRFPAMAQTECRLTATCEAAHEVIRANLHRAPMYSGQIEAECGPRYCPSIEDKVQRFADRPSHHVFLEPESLHTEEIYCNGISTSLPVDVQERIVHLMAGCERAVILRHGYAVEYDMVWPHQIDATCMTKSIEGLFLAGQINCTTGYEEAGGQGLTAGLNAARLVAGAELVRWRRDQAYLGVLLDDLVTKTPREPYRMFTSRAEHRLLLRADNADERLTGPGHELGLVDDRRHSAWRRRKDHLERIQRDLERVRVDDRPVRDLARRPDVSLEVIARHLPEPAPMDLLDRAVTAIRYEGYIQRQRVQVRRQAEAETRPIPHDLDPGAVSGLRAEAAGVLRRFRPRTLGQAGRLAGVNPADLTLLAVAIRRHQAATTPAAVARHRAAS
jgi:tRNA uridine 5-carboxymethylaminomethyl modification enzyme